VAIIREGETYSVAQVSLVAAILFFGNV